MHRRPQICFCEAPWKTALPTRAERPAPASRRCKIAPRRSRCRSAVVCSRQVRPAVDMTLGHPAAGGRGALGCTHGTGILKTRASKLVSGTVGGAPEPPQPLINHEPCQVQYREKMAAFVCRATFPRRALANPVPGEAGHSLIVAPAPTAAE